MKLLKCLAVAIGVISSAAQADYPERPVRLVVPFAPGGNIDVTARIISVPLSGLLGQPVVVENRPGAGGVVGSEAVARAPADGYTLLLGSSGGIASAKALSPDIKLDPTRDLVGVAPISRAPLVLVVRADSQIQTVSDFVAVAKARQGGVSIASSGTGTAAHLTAELLQIQAGIKLTHVPYRGSGPAISDLLGGQVDATFDQLASTLPHMGSGKLRALAVTTRTRSTLVPTIPTFAESNFPEFESSTTTGLMAPSGTPPAVLQRLTTALNQALQQPQIRQRFADLNSEVITGNGPDFDQILALEIRKWSDVVKVGKVHRP